MQQAVLERPMPALEEDLRTLSQAIRVPERNAKERPRDEDRQREIRATLAYLERLLGAGD
jgi:hypothetical protein